VNAVLLDGRACVNCPPSNSSSNSNQDMATNPIHIDDVLRQIINLSIISACNEEKELEYQERLLAKY
jgi:hypothetical protein